ncbi:MAG: hypothetical protein Q9159_005985 [Coniocarpon cinnabarinum]
MSEMDDSSEQPPIAVPDNQKSVNYLESLLGQQLRIHISDGRIFVGQFKCTDKEANVILSNAMEFRSVKQKDSDNEEMRSRLVGLIVVPGPHIRKVEHEQFRKKK